MMKDLAVVIATRNRPEECEAAWRSVREVVPEAQLIVVEQVTEDEHYLIADDFSGTWHQQWAAGVSRARNLGLTSVDRAHVLFLDDDAVVLPAFIDLLRAHVEAGVDVTCGRVCYGGASSGPAEPSVIASHRVGKLFIEFSAIWNTGSVRAVGGFDERLGTGRELGAEEGPDLMDRLRADGFGAFRFEPIDAYGHPVVDKPTYSKARSYGRGMGALLVFNPSWWLLRYVGYTAAKTAFAVLAYGLRGSVGASRIRASRLRGLFEGFARAVQVRRSGETRLGAVPARSLVVRNEERCHVGRPVGSWRLPRGAQ